MQLQRGSAAPHDISLSYFFALTHSGDTYKKPRDKSDFRAFVSKRFHPDFSKIKKGAFANLVRTGMNRDGNLWLVLRVLGFQLSDMWPLR